MAEDLETPKIPKRIPKYLSLEESVRLLIASEYSARNHCIITIFLNCALRLSELTSLDVEQVSADTLQVIGKGNKERKIFLTSATKKALEHWLKEREKILAPTNAVFCKHFLDKVAKYFWTLLHVQIGQSCKALASHA